jgi:hypothetical protein
VGLEQGHAQAARLRSQGYKHAGSASAKDGNVFFHAGANQGPRSGTRLSKFRPVRLKQG